MPKNTGGTLRPKTGSGILPLQSLPSAGRATSKATLALAFGLGAISFFYVAAGGQLYVAELMLAAGLLFTAPFHKRPRLGHGLAAGLLLWGFASLCSDLWNGSDTLALTKGLLRVVFLAIDIYALYYLCNGRASVVKALWWGLVASFVLAYFLQPSLASHGEPWKFGFGLPVTIAVILWVTSRPSSRIQNVLVFSALGAVHFAMGFRSMASIVLIVALLLAVQTTHSRLANASRIVRFRPVVLGVLGATLILWLSSIYDRLAQEGAFGYIAQQKAAFQAGGEFGSSLSSRSEFLLSFQSISQSPFWGGGSYSIADSSATDAAATFLNDLGYSEIASRLARGAPAYHSEILGVWAENGILTLLFWFAVAAILVGAIYAVIYQETAMPQLVVYLAVSGLWDLLFSPFGADRRFWLAASIATILLARKMTKEDGNSRGNGFDLDNKPESKDFSGVVHTERPQSEVR